MGAVSTTSDVLDQALRSAGLEEAFDDRGIAHEDCPGCGATRGLKLSLGRGRVHCSACGSEGPLLAYLREKAEAGEWNHEPYAEAEIIPIEPRRCPANDDEIAERCAEHVPVPVSMPHAVEVELVEELASDPVHAQMEPLQHPARHWGERIIISLLALVFLAAGLAAAALSGFANYQAFSAGVLDAAQARVWGWSGVIASVCSFGGFTFFWWHMSGRRLGEAMRSLVFALAGAGTSIAGTSLFMLNNAQQQDTQLVQAQQVQALREAEIADWTRQLDGIPAETRSIEGLEAYLAGVEAAGRTHQKPYRDAQNELGQARRRALLEDRIAGARAELRQAAEAGGLTLPAQNLPAWFFALMLELFSSQGTSIAFVSLLLLFGARPQIAAEPERGRA
nr:hypothetical protein [Hyphomonas sp. Mor2]